MIEYTGDSNNVSDLYLRNCFYWATRSGVKIPVVKISAGDYITGVDKDKFVLMITGNETHSSLDYYYDDPRVVAIIKNYPHIQNVATDPDTDVHFDMVSKDNVPRFPTIPESPKTLNIPLGITNTFPTYCLPERSYRTGFIGQWTKIREHYVKRIAKLLEEKGADLEEYQFAFYAGFGPFVQGNPNDGSLPTEAYAANLASYDMSLCFSGQSPETFRLFEAASVGCGLISTPLPDVWYYKHLPALYILPEMDFEKYFVETLHDAATVKEYQRAAQAWYHQYASPPAVGKKIAEHLESLK